jgi:hypothetical protein
MENISKNTLQKGYQLFNGRKVVKEVETERRIHFKVIGDTDNYSVIFDKKNNSWDCDCKFNTLKSKECSHIRASRLMIKHFS